jgi:hypothetical protein
MVSNIICIGILACITIGIVGWLVKEINDKTFRNDGKPKDKK